MAEREKTDKSATSTSSSQRRDERDVSQNPDVGERDDTEAQRSTTSRPRGHTEEPDRTL